MQRLFTIATVLITVATTVLFGQEADVQKVDGAKAGAKKADGKHNSARVTSLPPVASEIHDALGAREFAKAVRLIDAELKSKKIAAKDYLLYLKGRAETELGKSEDAIATFTRVEKEYPKSVWRWRAQFGRADVLVRNRNYEAAGDIYRTAADRLLSSGRRDELAGIYLEFADRYFDGIPAKDPSAKPKPDFKQALTYYAEALKIQPSNKTRQRVDLRIAQCQQGLKQLPQAIAAFNAFLATYASEKTAADLRCTPGQEVKARYELGRAQLAAGQRSEARKTWLDFLKNEVVKKHGKESLAEAAYRLASTYQIPTPPNVTSLELGVAMHERFLKQYPEHELASTVHIEIAQSYANLNRNEEAIARLKSLIADEQFKDCPKVALARFMLGNLYRSQKKFDEAIAAWREFLNEYPTDSRWASVQKQVIDVEFQRANEQRNKKNYAVARKLWSTFLNKYPLDSRTAQILYHFGDMHYAEAVTKRTDEAKAARDANVKNFDPRKISKQVGDQFQTAIADWERLVSKYPSTTQASQASFMIGVVLEDQLGKLPEALDAYKKVKGNLQSQARQRIQKLTAKQLTVATERKFRSNESAKVKVTSRNLESLSVKVYRIDMVDYFRKMHLASGVEDLDIALIDPDKQWEYKVDGFEKFRRLENEITIPVDGPGVTAVTVSSDKLEATTMLVVSDLDMIVKASRNELFVFVQDMVKRKPAAEVSVMVSDGKEVFATEITSKGGVVQKSFDQLKSVKDLRVFAVGNGSSASTVSNLNGLDFAVGLSPKGYLFTDRPAYRAGQLVNIKGIIRWVNEDRYTFKAGAEYKISVNDSRGRVVHTGKVKLNAFGTFHDNFLLPKLAPQGQYVVNIRDDAKKQSFSSQFQVHEYKLEPIELTVDLPQAVYYRGEAIKGTIKLAYYYGTPLANRAIIYRLSGGRQHTAQTNAKGEVTFEFETQEFRESQMLQLLVTYAERNLSIAKPVILAVRGFDIDVSTLRDVYISGETFDTEIKVADPSGKAVGTDLKLEVLEQTTVNGEVGERLVTTHALKSDKDSGKARHTLRVDNAGRYIVRATGTDRFGNRISSSHSLWISGNDDSVRLRILADKHEYNVGEEASIQLHWRNEPALALVTYEGAVILGHRLVELKKGTNKLALPMESKLAPNFQLAVAVMEGHRLHAAASEFRLIRKLNIVLKPNKSTLKPGDELKVEVVVTDPQGKPVSAEVSLGLIQRNLLERFGANAGSIGEFFGHGYRQPSLRTMTSATFTYRPRTRGISQFLLAEEERERVLSLELSGVADAWAAMDVTDGTATGRILTESATSGINTANDDFDVASGQIDMSNQSRGKYRLNTFGRPQRGQRLGRNFNQNGNLAIPLFENGQGQAGAPFRLNSSADSSGEFIERDGDGTRSHVVQRGHHSNLGDQIDFFVQQQQEVGQAIRQFDDNYSIAIRQTQTVHAAGRANLDTISNLKTTILAINNDGELLVANGLGADRLGEMAKAGIKFMPQLAGSETAFWDPVVTTDKAGKATVTLRLPDRSTAWKLQSKGINAEELSGEASVDLVTRKDLFGELKLPLAFIEGDKADVIVEVHNSVVKKGGTIQVELKTTIGDRSTTLKRTVKSDGAGMHEVSFPVEITKGDSVAFGLTVSSGDLADATVTSVAVRPHGMDVFASASGSAAQSTIAFVEHDKALTVQDSKLEIVIGPSINRTLLDAVLGADLSIFCSNSRALAHSGLERSISDVLGGVSLLETIRKARSADSPETQALSGQIQSAVLQLVSGQRDDGGWNWSGGRTGNKSDRYLTSRVVWALSAARRSGFSVPQGTLDKAVKNLQTAYTKSSQNDREGKAIILHGLTEAGSGDFAFANRLYRERNSLSASSLLHVALTLARLDRKEMASELVKLVKVPTKAPQGADPATKGLIPWMQSGSEVRALYLLALSETAPADPKLAELADTLLSGRTGSRWYPEKANGPAIAALSQWFGRTKFANEKYRLSVYVNTKLVETFEVNPGTDASRRLEVDPKLLVAGKPQQINFDIEGRGRFSYSAVLAGFVPAERLRSTTGVWSVARYYEPALRMMDGQPIPRGFGILTGGYSTFRNPLTQLPVGERAHVTLQTYRNYGSGQDPQIDYLIVTEPIPAGTTVLTDSIEGPFDRFEITPGAITFYIGDRPGLGDIHYTLVGYLPGSYRSMQTVIRSFYQPGKIAVSSTKKLDVLARGVKSKDKYKLTPVEFYEYGKRYLAKGDHAKAAESLQTLFRSHRLKPSTYQHVVRMLFQCALVNRDHKSIVEYFEIIKERFPEVEIKFDEMLQVAASYKELGEYERSYLVYRATVEGSFQRESQIPGFLGGRGEFVRSVQVLERLLNEYPAEAYVAMVTYALAQEVYGKGEEAASDARLRKAGISRTHLIANSIHMLDHFVSTWPKDPMADQASFALASAMLDLEQFDPVIKRCEKFADRYTDSDLLDSFWYVIGYSQFALGKHEAALTTCRKVAEHIRKDSKTGEEREAGNKWESIYIMGQIFHSLGEPAKAIAEYAKVKERFSDATESIEFFTRKDIKLPEVTTVRPGDMAKVKLSHRNVASANTKVYRIDLLKFSLLQRNLDQITAINLAGIRPYHELNLKLGDGNDYKDLERELQLPLKEEGAYLVVCRGDNLYTSGLVLVSPLKLEIQEDATSGRVRVTVKDSVKNEYTNDVHVKVIGSRNSDFISGETDLRGIFVADKIQGTGTVIARADTDRYAFYRGKTQLGPKPQPAEQASPQQPAPNEDAQQKGGKGLLLDNVRGTNSFFNQEQRLNYKNLLNNGNTGGVKAKLAY